MITDETRESAVKAMRAWRAAEDAYSPIKEKFDRAKQLNDRAAMVSLHDEYVAAERKAIEAYGEWSRLSFKVDIENGFQETLIFRVDDSFYYHDEAYGSIRIRRENIIDLTPDAPPII